MLHRPTNHIRQTNIMASVIINHVNTTVRVDITVKEATIVKADIIVDIIRGITQDIMMVINHVSVPTLKT